MSCRLQTYFETRLALMAPSETVVLNRDSLAWILENHAACACSGSAGQEQAAPSMAPARFTAAALAAALGRQPSTIRNHLSKGLCGQPAAVKDAHGEFWVPAAHVEAVQQMLDDGHSLGTFCVLASATAAPAADGEPGDAGGSGGARAPRTEATPAAGATSVESARESRLAAGGCVVPAVRGQPLGQTNDQKSRVAPRGRADALGESSAPSASQSPTDLGSWRNRRPRRRGASR